MTYTRRARIFLATGQLLSRPAMRPLTRTFSTLHALAYRMTRGRAQSTAYPTLLLTVTGRKSGKPRTVPLVYIRDQDRNQFVVAAAYSGSDTHPTWWLNLRAHPHATIRINNHTHSVRAEHITEPDERTRLWNQLVQMYPYFTDYQQRTIRQIPVITLTPDHPSTS